jgi:hypothetical protein
MSLDLDLEAAEARVAQLKQQIAHGTCAETGHDWKHIGGCNAGCGHRGDCCCSVPVHVCTKCGDSDYGDNAEADETRAKCAEQGGAASHDEAVAAWEGMA